jgi:hypothetical protein
MITTYISDEDKNKFLTNTINGVCNHLNELPGIDDRDPVRQFFGGEQFSNFKTQIGSAKTARGIENKKKCARAALDNWQFGLSTTRTPRVNNLLFYVVLLRNVLTEFKEHPDDVWSRDSETNKIVTVKRDEYFARQKLSHDERCRRDIATTSLRLRIHKLLCDT